MRVFLLRGGVAVINYVFLLLAFRSDSVLKWYALSAPMGVYATILVDRGRGEYVLRKGLPTSAYKEALVGLWGAVGLLIACYMIYRGVVGVSLRKDRLYLAGAIVIQSLAQGWVDILLRASVHETSKVNVILGYQIFSSLGYLACALVGLYLPVENAELVLLLSLAPLLYPLLILARKEWVTSIKREGGEAPLPIFSLLDLVAKVLPATIYGALIALCWNITLVPEIARVGFFLAGVSITNMMSRQDRSPFSRTFLQIMVSIIFISVVTVGLMRLDLSLQHPLVGRVSFPEIWGILSFFVKCVGVGMVFNACAYYYYWNLKR